MNSLHLKYIYTISRHVYIISLHSRCSLTHGAHSPVLTHTHSTHSLTQSLYSSTHSNHSHIILTRNTHAQYSLTALTHDTHSLYPLTHITHSLKVLTHNAHSRCLLNCCTHSPTVFTLSKHSLTALTHLLTVLTHMTHSSTVLTHSRYSLTVLISTHSLTHSAHSAHCTHDIPSYTMTLSYAGAYHPSLILPASSTKSGDLIHLVSHFFCSTGNVSTGTTHAALSKGSARLTWMTKFFQ